MSTDLKELEELAIREARDALVNAFDAELTNYTEFSEGDGDLIDVTIFDEEGDEVGVLHLRVEVVR